MTDAQIDDYIVSLQRAGWLITLNHSGSAKLPASISQRHPRIPEDYLKFISRVSTCVNGNETVWFLCADDYYGRSDSAYAWNEFELMELEGLDEHDEARNAIIKFWDEHLPFMISVSGEYAHLSFALTAKSFGAVVEGWELQLREVTNVAPSFEEFVRLHSAALLGDFGDTILRDYV
ncbi:MAG TPA: hypothetical protein VLB68_29135 [Pyrinomonadaceae bacterium]|nr:hypothetical protein [Pyrinomonadaceae bacterium]